MFQVVVSFSGGRTSGYLCYLIKLMYPNAIFIFMDTGAEHPKTYAFIRQCNDHFGLNLVCLRTLVHEEDGVGCSYQVISIDEIGDDLQPWRDMCKKYSTPYRSGAFCTERMKTLPAKKYLDKTYGVDRWQMWLGMRVDEPDRLKPKRRISYLAEISNFDRQDVLDWWAGMPFDLQLPEHLGNCVFCIKKGENKLALAARDEPELAAKFIKMVEEDSVKVIETRRLGTLAMYRQGLSLQGIIEAYADVSRERLAYKIRSTSEAGNCSESCEGFTD